MTRIRKALAGFALVALIAPAAVVAAMTGPAAADGNGKDRHDLDTYKREAWFEIRPVITCTNTCTATRATTRSTACGKSTRTTVTTAW